MKLCQGQIWKQGGEYLRIVHLTRTEVEYKSMTSLATRDGKHIRATKKAFCRLVKDAVLMQVAKTPASVIAPVPTVEKP